MVVGIPFVVLWQVFASLHRHQELKEKARARQALQQELTILERSHNPLFHVAQWLKFDCERELEKSQKEGLDACQSLSRLEAHLLRAYPKHHPLRWILVKDPPPSVLVILGIRTLYGESLKIPLPMTQHMFHAIGEDLLIKPGLFFQDLWLRLREVSGRIPIIPAAAWNILIDQYPKIWFAWTSAVRVPAVTKSENSVANDEILLLHRMFLRKLGLSEAYYREQLRLDAPKVIDRMFAEWMTFEKLDYLLEGVCAQFGPFQPHRKNLLMCWFHLFDQTWLNGLDRLPPKTRSFSECEAAVSRHVMGSLQFFIDSTTDMTAESRRCVIRLLEARGIHGAFLSRSPDQGRTMAHSEWNTALPCDPSALSPGQTKECGSWLLVQTRMILGRSHPLLLGIRWKDKRVLDQMRSRDFLLIASMLAMFGLLLFLVRPFHVSLPYQLSVLFALVMAPPVIQGMIAVDQLTVERHFRLNAEAHRELERSMTGMDRSLDIGLAWTVAYLRESIASAAQSPKWLLPVKQELPDIDFENAMGRLGWYGVALDMAAKHVAGQAPRLGRIFLEKDTGERTQLMNAFSIVIGALFQQMGFEEVAANQAHQSGKNLGDGLKASEIVALLQRLLFAESFAQLFFSLESLVDMSVYGRRSFFYNQYGGMPRHPWLVQTVFSEGFIKPPVLRGFWKKWGKTSLWSVRTDRPLFQSYPPFSVVSGVSDILGIIEYNEPAPAFLVRLAQLSTLTGVWAFDTIGAGNDARLLGVGPSRFMPRNIIFAQYRIGEEIDREARYWHGVQRILYLLITIPFALALLIGRRLVEPLVELRETAARVAGGNYSARLRAWSGKEFVLLSQAFREMTESLAGGRLLKLFVSESVRQSVIGGAQDIQIKPHEEFRLVLFISLSGLKQRWKGLAAAQVLAELNEFLEATSRCIRLAGGDVDKFVGEKVLAAFSPRGEETREAMLVRAFGAISELLEWERTRNGRTRFPPAIGMIWGPLLVGRLGTEDVRLEQAMIGDTVNLASRLCDQALAKGGGCLTDERTATMAAQIAAQMPHLEISRLGSIRIKGKRREVDVHQIVYRGSVA